jgi:protein TonB
MIGRFVLVATMLLFSGALHVGLLGLWPHDPEAKRPASLEQVVIDSSDALFGEAILPVSNVGSKASHGRPGIVGAGEVVRPVGEIPRMSPTLDASRAKDASIDPDLPARSVPPEANIGPVPGDKLGQTGTRPLPVAAANAPPDLAAGDPDSATQVKADSLVSTVEAAAIPPAVRVLHAPGRVRPDVEFTADVTELPRGVPGEAASIVPTILLWEDNDESSLARIGTPIAVSGRADETAKTLPVLVVGASASGIDLLNVPVRPLPPLPPLLRGYHPGSPVPEVATADAAEGEVPGDPIAPSEEKEQIPTLAADFEPAALPSIVTMRRVAAVLAVESLSYDAMVEPLSEIRKKDPPVSNLPARQSSETKLNPVPANLARYLQQIRSEVARVRPVESRPRMATGTAVVAAIIRLDGTLLETRLAASSGHHFLDRIAIDRVRRAAPFAPVPVSEEYHAVTVRVPISFGGHSARH